MVDQTPVYPLRSPTGRVLGVVRRTGFEKGPKYLYPKGIDVKELLFNYSYEPRDRVVLVEGAADAIACWEVGVDAFAIYGSRLSVVQCELINRLQPDQIVCAFDLDNAGGNAFRGVKMMFPSMSINRLTWTGAKDIAELDETHRKEIFERLDYGEVDPVLSVSCSSQRGNQKEKHLKTLSPVIGRLSWP